MRRAVASSLLVAVLLALGLVCPCPAVSGASAPMADDHSCCGKQGLRAASSCCLTSADAPKPAALDAAPALPAPVADRADHAPVVLVSAPVRIGATSVSPSPPAVLRI